MEQSGIDPRSLIKKKATTPTPSTGVDPRSLIKKQVAQVAPTQPIADPVEGSAQPSFRNDPIQAPERSVFAEQLQEDSLQKTGGFTPFVSPKAYLENKSVAEKKDPTPLSGEEKYKQLKNSFGKYFPQAFTGMQMYESIKDAFTNQIPAAAAGAYAALTPDWQSMNAMGHGAERIAFLSNNNLLDSNPEIQEAAYDANLKKMNGAIQESKIAAINYAIEKKGASSMSPTIKSLSQIEDPLDIVNFVVNASAQSAAQIPLSVATGGATSVVQEIGNTYVESVMEIAERNNMTPQEVMAKGLDEREISIFSGVITGALDAIGAKGVSKVLPLGEIKKSLRRRAVIALGGMLKEGATEAAQSAISQTAVNFSAGDTPIEAINKIDTQQLLDEGVAGAIGGGVLNASINSVSKPATNETQETTQTSQTVNPEAAQESIGVENIPVEASEPIVPETQINEPTQEAAPQTIEDSPAVESNSTVELEETTTKKVNEETVAKLGEVTKDITLDIPVLEFKKQAKAIAKSNGIKYNAKELDSIVAQRKEAFDPSLKTHKEILIGFDKIQNTINKEGTFTDIKQSIFNQIQEIISESSKKVPTQEVWDGAERVVDATNISQLQSATGALSNIASVPIKQISQIANQIKNSPSPLSVASNLFKIDNMARDRDWLETYNNVEQTKKSYKQGTKIDSAYRGQFQSLLSMNTSLFDKDELVAYENMLNSFKKVPDLALLQEVRLSYHTKNEQLNKLIDEIDIEDADANDNDDSEIVDKTARQSKSIAKATTRIGDIKSKGFDVFTNKDLFSPKQIVDARTLINIEESEINDPKLLRQYATALENLQANQVITHNAVKNILTSYNANKFLKPIESISEGDIKSLGKNFLDLRTSSQIATAMGKYKKAADKIMQSFYIRLKKKDQDTQIQTGQLLKDLQEIAKKAKMTEDDMIEVNAFGRFLDLSTSDYYSKNIISAVEENIDRYVQAIKDGIQEENSNKKRFAMSNTKEDKLEHELAIFEALSEKIKASQEALSDYEDGQIDVAGLAKKVLGKNADFYTKAVQTFQGILPDVKYNTEILWGSPFEERVNYFPSQAIGRMSKEKGGFLSSSVTLNSNADKAMEDLISNFESKEISNYQSSNTLTRQDASNGVYYDNNAMSVIDSYLKRTVADINISQELFTLTKMLNSDKAKAKLGAQNIGVLKENLKETVRNIRGRNIDYSNAVRWSQWIVNNMASSTLLSLSQIATQTLPAMVGYLASSPKSIVSMGKAFSFMASMDGFKFGEHSRIKEWEENNTSGLALRNYLFERMDMQSKFKHETLLKKAKNSTQWIEKGLSILLKNPDKFVARLLYITELYESGATDLNNLTEEQVSRAERLIENKLNVNSPNFGAGVSVPKNQYHRILLSLFMPFRGFPMQNTVTNVIGGIANIRSKEAAQGLVYATASGLFYNIMQEVAIQSLYESLAGAIMGEAGDEGEEQQEKEKEEEQERFAERGGIPKWSQKAMAQTALDLTLGGGPEFLDNFTRADIERRREAAIKGEFENGDISYEYDKYKDGILFVNDYSKNPEKQLGAYGSLYKPVKLIDKILTESESDEGVSDVTQTELAMHLLSMGGLIPSDVRKVINKIVQNQKAKERANR